jgi:AcrR family transcriptional regulator
MRAQPVLSPGSNSSMPSTRDRIVQCAAEAFATDGFRMATIRHIAEAAAVNEITVYRYFPKKQCLYWEAIEWKLDSSGILDSLDDALVASESLATLVSNLSGSVADVIERDGKLARLLLFSALELREEKERLISQHVNPFLNSLTHRISGWIKVGTIREIDPRSAALVIGGMLLSQLTVNDFARPDSHYGQSWQQMTQGLVTVLSSSGL